MELSVQEYQYLVSEITRETGAKRDGSGKNLIVPRCPFCGKSGGKFGIYIGKATAHRRPFMAHCFSCGASTRTLEQLLAAIGRMDLMVLQTADIAAPLNLHLLEKDEAEEIDWCRSNCRTFTSALSGIRICSGAASVSTITSISRSG